MEINSGTHIPNLNDPFVTDGQPDLGAFEYGEPLPAYGPQPLTPDFSASKKQASQIAPSNGQIITYTITLVNQGSPLTGTLSSDGYHSHWAACTTPGPFPPAAAALMTALPRSCPGLGLS